MVPAEMRRPKTKERTECMSDTPTTQNKATSADPMANEPRIDENKSEAESAAKAKKMEAEAKAKEVAAAAKMASVEAYDRAMQVNTTYMNPNTWTQMRTMAKVFYEGHALPSCIQNEAQLVMVLQAGFEMGMKPVECLKSLYIVNGSVNVYGAATVRRLREHGWRVTYKGEDGNSCTARVVRDREAYEETYTFAEAEKSGYTTDNKGKLKIGWKEGINRKLKLRYGVLSLIIKSYIPDVLGSANDIVEVAEDAVIVEEEKPKRITTGDTITNGNGKQAVNHKSLADKLAEAKQKKQQPEQVEPVKVNKKEKAVKQELKENDEKVLKVSGTPSEK